MCRINGIDKYYLNTQGEKVKRLIFILPLLSLLSLSVTANDTENYTIISDSGTYFKGNLEDFIASKDIPAPSSSNSLTAFNTDSTKYFLFNDGSNSFMNISGECKVLVFWVTSGKGYDKRWYHIAQSFDTFKWPPYKKSSTSVTKRVIGSMECDDSFGSDWIEY